MTHRSNSPAKGASQIPVVAARAGLPGIGEVLPAGVAACEISHSAALNSLHPAEARCVERAAASRLQDFASGRYCARQALAKLGVHGFPLLAGEDRVPNWPEGFVGSITHTDGYCGRGGGSI